MSDEFMTLLLIGGIFLLFGILFIIASFLIANNKKEKGKTKTMCSINYWKSY